MRTDHHLQPRMGAILLKDTGNRPRHHQSKHKYSKRLVLMLTYIDRRNATGETTSSWRR
jgi:hypothetical protein